MALSRVNYGVNNLMRTRRVDRVSYPISGHNLVTGYIMVLNPDRTRSVRLTKSTPFYYTTILTYEIELSPAGNKIGLNLLNVEYFTIPYVIDTNPNSSAGH